MQEQTDRALEVAFLGTKDRDYILSLDESARAEGLPLFLKFGRMGWHEMRCTNARSNFGGWGYVKWDVEGVGGEEQEEEQERHAGVILQGKLSETFRFVKVR